MSVAVLATKLFAPVRRSQDVARTRLLVALDATLEPGHRLTLVSAPAGFGKTTVLSDWVAQLAVHPVRARSGWLSLDEADNDPVRFMTHLVAALGSTGVELDPAAVLQSLPGDATAALTALVNAMAVADAVSGTQRVLVLDDYHVITAPEVHDAVEFLLEHLPGGLHLVMATRADPPLPLPRLRSRGHLAELRVGDLRFTGQEAHQFLNQAMHLGLDRTQVDSLEERTEGWIAGLQLAALSLRAMPTRPEVTHFIEDFAGSHRFVIDYLADEVLARQPPDVHRFLLRTSVLERLTGPLCDAVLDRTGGAAMLEDLERANAFVVPLDTDRTWYRYHHLFADVLRARLLAEDPDVVPLLHRRASDWYAGRGLVADAVRHALAAEDHDRAAFLMEEGVGAVRRARQDSLLLAWIRALPQSIVRERPVLSIVSGWSHLMAGDLDGLERCLDDADAALEAGSRDPALADAWAATEDLRTAPATILIYRASLAQARGDVPGTMRHARGALALAGPDDHTVRGGAGGFLGLAAWAAGDLEEAISTFAEAVRSLHAAGNLVDELDATVVLADMWIASGRPDRARELYDRALLAATEGGEPYPRATSDLHVGLADLDRELGDLPGAEAHLEAARMLGERASITEGRHRWPLAMALVRAAQDDDEAAMSLLDRAAALYRPGFYPDVRPIAAVRARLRIATGDLESAADWAREGGVSVDDAPEYLREYEHLTLVRLLLARSRAGGPPDPHGPDSPLDAALTLLDRLDRAATDAGRVASLEEIRALRSLAGGTTGSVVGPQPIADPLTQRELDVLRLLTTDLTGPQIAGELYVSLNTLRTHTKRIFTKLDVRTRAAAVRRAREHRLI